MNDVRIRNEISAETIDCTKKFQVRPLILLTDSWLGLRTVENTDGLNVGKCIVSIDTCDSNGLSLDPLGVFSFPADPLESEYLISPLVFGVSAPTMKTLLSLSGF